MLELFMTLDDTVTAGDFNHVSKKVISCSAIFTESLQTC